MHLRSSSSPVGSPLQAIEESDVDCGMTDHVYVPAQGDGYADNTLTDIVAFGFDVRIRSGHAPHSDTVAPPLWPGSQHALGRPLERLGADMVINCSAEPGPDRCLRRL